MDLKLHKLTRQELEELRKGLNLTEDEEIVFNMLSKRKSIIEIADCLNLSVRTIKYRVKDIRYKMNKIAY